MHSETKVMDQVARHADNVEAVRVRFTPVKDASVVIASDDSAYGLLCRWVHEDFQARHVRQDELFAKVENNLWLIGGLLCEFAAVLVLEPDPVDLAAAESLVAPVTVREATLVGWTMEDVQPLRDVLDRLTGKPDVIAAHVATWNNVAVELRDMADDLEDFVEYDIPDWHGDEADEHRRLMGHNVEAIRGLSSISAALAEVTETVGVLVAQTRRILRDFITDLTTLTQDGTFVRWTRRIAVYAVALHITLTHLEQRLNG